MFDRKQHECIRACKACAKACLQSAVACMEEENHDAMQNCIAADLHCAKVCLQTVQAMVTGGKDLDEYYLLCANTCQNSSLECSDRKLELCQFSSDMRALCANACREMFMSNVVTVEESHDEL